MSSAAQLPELDAFPGESLPARKTRGVFVVFATMVTVGLGLGGWYVGNRILAAEGVQANSAPQAVTNEALEASKPIAAAAEPAPQELRPLAADYYLQIAALGAPQDLKYVKQLQSKGF